MGMNQVRTKTFFLTMGWLFLLVAVIGFGPSFIFLLIQGDFDHPTHVYIHALFTFGWLILFIVQASLIGSRRLSLHKKLGIASTGLFVALMLSAISVSINGLLKPLPPRIEHLIDNIFFLQLCVFVLAPTFFVLALKERHKRPEHHKRYMYLLTFFLIEAAASRMTYLPGVGNEDTFLIAQYLYLDLLLIPLLVYDLRTLGRLSQATIIGIGILLSYQTLAVLVWDSHWWISTVNSIEAVLGQFFG